MNCYNLSSVTIGSGVTSIGGTVFCNCESLVSITIPNNVRSIGDQIFDHCLNLTSVTIGSGVTSIGNAPFYFCTALSSINVDENNAYYKSIDGVLFSKDMKEIICCPITKSGAYIIPDGVTTIANQAFELCENLTSLVVPDGVESIGDRAFGGCTNLSSITFPDCITSINGEAFQGCLWYNQQPDGLIYVGKVLYKYKGIIPSNTNVVIKEGTVQIAKNAFVYSSQNGLTSVVIPNSVTTIGDEAFFGCSQLTTLTLGSGLITIGNNAFMNCMSLTSVEMPNSVTTIGDGAFVWCKKLASITFSNSITYLGKNAFGDTKWYDDLPDGLVYIGKFLYRYKGRMSDDADIIIEDGTETICFSAFSYQDGLRSLTIPNSVKSIEDNVFSGVDNLMQIYCYAEDVPNTTNDTFSNFKMKYVSLYVPASSLNKYKNSAPWNNFYEIVALPGENYTLTYMLDGEVYKTVEISAGSEISPEEAPTKEGYTFSGWSNLPETMPDHDVTVTGTFTINKYKLTYLIDGEVYNSYEVDYSATISPEDEPTKVGYTFSGWSEIPETMPAHDVTVTGSFTINKYKLTYLVDGEEYKSYEVEYSATITPEDEPSKEGYTFSGWSNIPSTMPAEDVTVTGTFSINSYKLTYIVDGEEYKSFEIEYGSSITPEDEPTKEGCTFSGWSEIPETMPAHDVEVIGTFTQEVYNIDNVTYVITGYDEVTITGGDETGEVTIESSVVINDQTYQVTAIAEDAFKGNQDMTSVTIPEGITTIGNNAFANCTGLILINIGKDVQTIGSRAFANVGTSSAARTRSEESTFVVNCYTESVPYTASDAFENTPIETGTLFVGDNLTKVFKATSPWFRFGKIYGFNETVGIRSIIIGTANAWIFDMHGNRLDDVRKGVNIIRTKEGKTKKIVVK